MKEGKPDRNGDLAARPGNEAQPSTRDDEPLVRIENLRKYFPPRGGAVSDSGERVKAVDGVSLEIRRGEAVGLVGESGCGKTTLGLCTLRLTEPSAGVVEFEGRDLSKLSSRELRSLRKDMQMVFQDPFGSLNPRMTVGSIIGEGLAVHRMGSARERADRVRESLEECGMDPAYAARFPHEFSGGQRQRIGIARAIALRPKFVICDEPVSALDVSIQSQIINLLVEIKERFRLTYLLISHDLSLVEYLSDRVAVMYLGRIVEIARREELFRDPQHPYTQALLSAVPRPEPHRRRTASALSGDVPSPLNPPPGCSFHPRCPLAVDVCSRLEPRESDENGHKVRCHVVEDRRTGLELSGG